MSTKKNKNPDINYIDTKISHLEREIDDLTWQLRKQIDQLSKIKEEVLDKNLKNLRILYGKNKSIFIKRFRLAAGAWAIEKYVKKSSVNYMIHCLYNDDGTYKTQKFKDILYLLATELSNLDEYLGSSEKELIQKYLNNDYPKYFIPWKKVLELGLHRDIPVTRGCGSCDGFSIYPVFEKQVFGIWMEDHWVIFGMMVCCMNYDDDRNPTYEFNCYAVEL